MNDGSSSSSSKTMIDEAPLYYPSYFRFQCRGAYHASSSSSNPHGSSSFSNNKNNGMNAGVCRGIQSRLEHVRDLQATSKPQAIQDFVAAASYYPTGGTSSNRPDSHNDPAYSSDPFNQDSPLLNQQAVVFENSSSPHPDGTSSPHYQDWSCYGSTQVHVLVLRSSTRQGEETVAGVAPDCSWGLTVRDVGNRDTESGDTVGTLRVGPLEISVGNHYEYEVQTEEEEEGHDEATRRGQSGKNDRGTRDSEGPEGDDDASQRRGGGRRKKPSEDASTPPVSLSSTAQKTAQKLYETSSKVVRHMKTNASILRDTVSDDFPARVVQSSHKIVNQFGKTVERTGKVMGNVYKLWRDQDDDDNDDEG